MGSAEGAVIVGRYIRENSEVLSFHLQRVMRSSTESVEAVLSFNIIKSVSSVAQLCPILCDPMDCSTPGFPVHHQLLELAQTHVHRVVDAIQPPHPVLSPSPPAFNLSQYQGLFQWVSSSHHVAKVLELQHQSFQWTPRTDLLAVQGTLKSLPPTPQFKSINSLSFSCLYYKAKGKLLRGVWLFVTPWTVAH